MQSSYSKSPIQFISVDGQRIAYRSIGVEGTTPIIYINHLAASLDNYDPLIMDSLATYFTIVSFDYSGVGYSEGKASLSREEMAVDAIRLIEALGYQRVHLLGLSLGGFVAQEILRLAPELVESVILAGTGPRGDRGIGRVPRITFYDMLRGLIFLRDPRYYLFFPTTKQARERANEFLARSSQSLYKDKPTSLITLIRQLRAVVAWAKGQRQDFSMSRHRVWVVNGDNDRMLPTQGSYALAKQFVHASLSIYEGAGHGAIFQEATLFSQQAIAFYKANDPQVNTKIK